VLPEGKLCGYQDHRHQGTRDQCLEPLANSSANMPAGPAWNGAPGAGHALEAGWRDRPASWIGWAGGTPNQHVTRC